MRNVIVYYIYDIRKPKCIRYVGQTSCKLQKRIWEHNHQAKIGNTNPVYNWIRKCSVDNIRFEIIKENAKWDEDEIMYIKKIRDGGHDLLNLTNGGEGTFGYKQSISQKSKKSKLMLKLWKQKEFRENLIIKHKNKKLSQEHKNNIGKSSKGRKHSENTKNKIRKGNIMACINFNRKGSNNNFSKLTDAKVRFIKLNKGIITQKIMAEKFSVSLSTVEYICQNKTWKHVVI